MLSFCLQEPKTILEVWPFPFPERTFLPCQALSVNYDTVGIQPPPPVHVLLWISLTLGIGLTRKYQGPIKSKSPSILSAISQKLFESDD